MEFNNSTFDRRINPLSPQNGERGWGEGSEIKRSAISFQLSVASSQVTGIRDQLIRQQVKM